MALGEILFKEIKDSRDWENKLQTWLTAHLLMLAVPGITSLSESLSATPPIQSSESVEHKLPESANPARGAESVQLVELITLMSEVVGVEQLKFAPGGEKKVHEFDVARLYLFSATWMSSRHTSDVLGTHEINLLYKHREKLKPTSGELHNLIRAVAADTSSLKPGWFWIRNLKPENVGRILVLLATSDLNTDVRDNALKLLTSAKIILPEERWPELPFWDDSAPTRFAAYNYLASLDVREALSFLEGLADSEDNPIYSFAAKQAALSVKLRLDPNQAFSELIARPELMSDDLLPKLRASIHDITDKVLLDGVVGSEDKIRVLCIEELVRRSALPKALAESLTNDDSAAIKGLAFDALVRMGEQVDLDKLRASDSYFGLSTIGLGPDSTLQRVFSSYSPERLEEQVDWFSVNGPVAYKSLALKHFNRISNSIRTDIQNGFIRIKEASEARLRAQFGVQAETLIKSFTELNKFVASTFLEAALGGLAVNAQPSDVEMARHHLSSGEFRLHSAALDIVSRFGDASDVSALLRLANEGLGPVSVNSARAALRLSDDPLQVVRELAATNKREIIGIGFQWLVEQPSVEGTQYCRELLEEQGDGNRVLSIYYLSQTLSMDELEKLLENYLARDSYFYNVVTWLDRLLYAPPPLREMFATELTHSL
jgi:hypothetical protein